MKNALDTAAQVTFLSAYGNVLTQNYFVLLICICFFFFKESSNSRSDYRSNRINERRDI